MQMTISLIHYLSAFPLFPRSLAGTDGTAQPIRLRWAIEITQYALFLYLLKKTDTQKFLLLLLLLSNTATGVGYIPITLETRKRKKNKERDRS